MGWVNAVRLRLLNRRNWRAHAACLNTDPKMFFPIGASPLALEQTREAKRICDGCKVCAQCLDWALATNQEAGVWGGLSADERRALRHRRR